EIVAVETALIANPPGTGGDDDGNGSSSTNPGGGDENDTTTPTYPTEHPRILLNTRKAGLQASLAANTPAAARFKTVVDSWLGGNDLGLSAWHAALMGQLTGQPQYCAKAIAVVDTMVTTAEAAIAAGSIPHAGNDSYYFVGEDIGDLALTYDWCFDTVTSSQKTRWLAYANQAIYNVWHPTMAMWGSHSGVWSGWSVDDPSDNYYYGFLKATMLTGLAAKGEDPQADGWITQFHDTKVMGQLVPTFDTDLVGGGSREGTGYGVAMKNLWQLYDFWQASTGERLARKTPHTRASMLSFIHQIVPTVSKIAPTGDQSRDSTASFFDYHRQYLQELVSLYPADPLAARAQMLLGNASVPKMGSAFMAVDDFLYENAAVTATNMEGLDTTYYAPGIGELYTRSGWDTHATWVNLIAGPYTQSHAHQDQGSILFYKDGWLAYDTVIDSHSGLPQETTNHSLVRVDSGGAPITQVASTTSQLVALHKGDGWVYASSDVLPAYNGKAGITKDQREIVYLLPDTVVVYDRVATGAGTQQTWQLATPTSPSISGTTATTTNAAHALHVQRFAPAGATSSVHNMNANSDFSSGFRLDETIAGGDQRYLHVLSVDSAVSSASSANDATVTVHMANGHTATVAFNRDAPGATLTYDGTVTNLASGVDSMPE
ncbi:MAG: hypothetical protein ABI678_09135, partial [Kofleriaceae bacterium]